MPKIFGLLQEEVTWQCKLFYFATSQATQIHHNVTVLTNLYIKYTLYILIVSVTLPSLLRDAYSWY